MVDDVGRVEVSVAHAAMELSDAARDTILAVGVPWAPGDRIRRARMLRVHALQVQDRSVVLELLAGATVAQVAQALMLSEAEVLARYQPVVDAVRAGAGDDLGEAEPGALSDRDPAGTAVTVDAWLKRHTEPWGAPPPAPVLRALARG